ncbi:MAG: hypothetical protein EOP34_10995 [Rickettsiales bacterium]|nr:MAG: hypothetical protein EOP34_10995 [Rickettsiales bacterium]
MTFEENTAFIVIGTEFEFNSTEQIKESSSKPGIAISRADYNFIKEYTKQKANELKLPSNFFINYGTFLVWTDDSEKFYNNEGFLIQAGAEGKDYSFIKYKKANNDRVPEGGILNTQHDQIDNNINLFNFNATPDAPNQLNCDVVVCYDIVDFAKKQQNSSPKFVIFIAAGGPKAILPINSVVIWADQLSQLETQGVLGNDTNTIEQDFGAKVVRVAQVQKPKPSESIISQIRTLFFGKQDNQDKAIEYIVINQTISESSDQDILSTIIELPTIDVGGLSVRTDSKK